MNEERIRAAWQACQPQHDAPWLIADILDSVLVVKKDGLYRRVACSVDGETVSFGAPEEIAITLEEVGEAAPLGGPENPSGTVWDVRILRFGRSQNGWLWTREA